MVGLVVGFWTLLMVSIGRKHTTWSRKSDEESFFASFFTNNLPLLSEISFQSRFEGGRFLYDSPKEHFSSHKQFYRKIFVLWNPLL